MEASSDKDRLYYLDIARGIGIILVIIGHISYLNDNTRIFVVSFHMPLFFIISGMLLFIKKENERPLNEVLKAKARRMMLPYFIYSILGILIYIVYYLLTGRDGGWPTVISDIVQTVTFYGFSVMWFLPAIFGAEILFLYSLKKAPAMPVNIAVIAILTAVAMIANGYLEAANAVYGTEPVFSVFHLVAVAILRVPICASFAAIGFYICALWSRFTAIGPAKFPALSIPADLFIGADLLGLTIVFSHINGVTDLHFLIFNNVFCYYVAAVAGSLGLILLCKPLEALYNTPPIRLLRYFGVNSLTIMVTHLNFYVLLAAEIGGIHFTKNLPEGILKHNIFMLLTVFFTLCGEVIIIEIIRAGKRLRYSSR